MWELDHPYRTAAFTRDWPPRHIPLSLRLRLLFADRQLIWLLRHGRYTIARRIREQRQEMRDGMLVPEWWTTFEFTTDEGSLERFQARTTEHVEWAEHEPLVYDPGWPEHATTLRHLPGAPDIEEDGTIVLRNSAWISD